MSESRCALEEKRRSSGSILEKDDSKSRSVRDPGKLRIEMGPAVRVSGVLGARERERERARGTRINTKSTYLARPVE